MVPEVAVAVFCLKTFRYAMYMWLPMFLLQHLGYSKTNAGMFSTMFEIGGILGSATTGYCLKRFCGPDIILVSSVPTELGEMDGRNAASAVIGFVNGIGSIGSFIEGPIIGWISDVYGWSGMFYSMILLSFAGAVACYRAHRIYEIKKKHLNLGSILVNH